MLAKVGAAMTAELRRLLVAPARTAAGLRGSVRTGLAEAVTDDPEAPAATRGVYLERFPRARAGVGAVLVKITLDKPS